MRAPQLLDAGRAAFGANRRLPFYCRALFARQVPRRLTLVIDTVGRRVQMLLLIGLVLMVFLLMARTRLFRAGQIGELMSNYSRFLAITGVHFLLFFGTRIYRVVRTLPSWCD